MTPMTSSSERPVFVIGSPRSGTTLLRLMLTCHRNLLIPPECGFALWLEEQYGDWKASDLNGRVEAFADDVVACKKFETWNLGPDEITSAIASDQPADYSGLVASVYRAFARRQKPGFQRWGDKNNYYLEHIPRLVALFPAASFVHIVRDPRSVACSYLELSRKAVDTAYAPRLPAEVGAIAASWKSDIAKIRAGFAELPESQRCEVRFEDVVSEPAATLARLCDGIGEPYDPGMLDYHEINRRTALEPKEFMGWKAKTLEPPQPDRVDRYLRDLEPEQIATIEAAAREELETYGYPVTS